MDSLNLFYMLSNMDISDINPFALAVITVVTFFCGFIHGMTRNDY